MDNTNEITITIDKDRLKTLADRHNECIGKWQKLKDKKQLSVDESWKLGYLEGQASIFSDLLDAISDVDISLCYVKAISKNN